ncbi:unnamed protein product, partial [Ilex paraguariensis]
MVEERERGEKRSRESNSRERGRRKKRYQGSLGINDGQWHGVTQTVETKRRRKRDVGDNV